MIDKMKSALHFSFLSHTQKIIVTITITAMISITILAIGLTPRHDNDLYTNSNNKPKSSKSLIF